MFMRPVRRPSVYALSAVSSFLILSLFYLCVMHGQRSSAISMTLPFQSHAGLAPLFGWSSFYGNTIIHSENWETVREVLFFNGLQGIEAGGVPFTITRAFYSFAASFLTPFLGLFPSFILLNTLAMAICAWTTWTLTRRLFRNSRSALFATILACGGIGMTAHIHEYCAHLAAFALYYVGVCLFYRSGIYFRRRPLRTHVLLGTYLACASLLYNSGVMLLGAYVLLALRRNRWHHIVFVAIMALSPRPLWI